MLPTLFQRIPFVLVAAFAVTSCNDSNNTPGNGSQGVSKTLQQPTFVGSSVGVVKSSGYSASFVMGAQVPNRVGQEYIVGNVEGEAQ